MNSECLRSRRERPSNIFMIDNPDSIGQPLQKQTAPAEVLVSDLLLCFIIKSAQEQ